MRRLLPIAALVLTGLVVHAPTAWACSCVADATPQKQFSAADVVFIGVVSKVATPEQTMGDVVAEMAVTQVFKGNVPTDANVHTSVNVAGCGIAFVAGSRYTVFAADDNGVWRANLCDGTTSDTGVLARAGFHAGSPIVPISPALPVAKPVDRTGPLAGAALMIVAVGVGFIGVLRARSGRADRPAG
jgi:hypothetical protein